MMKRALTVVIPALWGVVVLFSVKTQEPEKRVFLERGHLYSHWLTLMEERPLLKRNFWEIARCVWSSSEDVNEFVEKVNITFVGV